MPPFGLAHGLLSARHPDTSPPAGGADPDDGQVATWSTALKAWQAKDPTPGGVTVHGLLTGLEYALLSGRSGGQALSGGLAASEHLTLQSTAHATRGRVRAQDDLQLLSGILRDSGGNNRIQLAAASPHLSLTGDVRATGHLGLGASGGVASSTILKAYETFKGNGTVYGADIYPKAAPDTGGMSVIGLQGIAEGQAPGASSFVRGLGFSARHNGAGDLAVLQGLYMAAQVYANRGAVSYLAGGYIFGEFGANTPVTDSRGLWIRNFGHAQVGAAHGLRIDNQANALLNYILWCGDTTPLFRVDGGAAPAGVNSNCIANFGGVLYRLTRNAATGAVETAAP